MLIELQCSNCGNRETQLPMGFWRKGWRFTGVPYCPHCVETWKERNGKEWNEKYDEEQMKEEFYEYLFNKIEMEKVDDTKYAIYENKDSFVKELNDIYDEIENIKNKLNDDYKDIAESYVSDLLEDNQDNIELLNSIDDDIEVALNHLSDAIDDIENLEIY